MTKFYATLEILNTNRGIVDLHDAAGEWFGGGIVEVGHSRQPLYELAYKDASQRAMIHGGTLETFRVV